MKRTFAFVGALLVATPAIANKGHVIQVHHGIDCVEFVLWEDAIAVCGANNVFLSNGTVNGTCLATVPWYGIATGQGTGQTPLTLDQLPFFIAGTSAIETAFHEWQAVNGAVDVQIAEGISVSSTENTLLFGPSSAIGSPHSRPPSRARTLMPRLGHTQ